MPVYFIVQLLKIQELSYITMLPLQEHIFREFQILSLSFPPPSSLSLVTNL